MGDAVTDEREATIVQSKEAFEGFIAQVAGAYTRPLFGSP
jgi:hypothetical protein